jgi:ribose transport system permease protein
MSEPSRSSSRAFERFLPPITLLVLIAATAVTQKLTAGSVSFLSLEKFRNILQEWSFVGIIALGMTLVIISGGIDLSVGSLVALAGACGLWVMNTAIDAKRILDEISSATSINIPAPYSAFRSVLAHVFIALHLDNSETTGVLLAIISCISIGLLAGYINGLLIARARVTPFIATLGGLAAYRSLAMAMTDGGTIESSSPNLFPKFAESGIPLPFIHLTNNIPLTIPWPVLIFFLLAILMAILLNHTPLGRYLFAIGASEPAARYSGINITRVKLRAYALLGALTGLAALLVASHTNSVSSSSTGQLYELDVIAAVVVGGTRMTGGSGTIFGTVIGVLILGVIGNMLNFLNVSIYLQGLVKGAIIVAAAVVQQVGQRKQA